MNRKWAIPIAAGAFAALLALRCSVSVNPGGGSVTFTAANGTFSLTLGLAGIFIAQPNTLVSNVADVQGLLFARTPTDSPDSGTIRLRSTSVQVLDPGSGKLAVAQQSVTGTATLKVFIGAAGAVNPCESGVDTGTFTITAANGQVTSPDQSLELSEEARSRVLTNNFTLCSQLEADFTGQVNVQGIDFEFGPDAGDDDDDDGGGICNPTNQSNECGLADDDDGLCEPNVPCVPPGDDDDDGSPCDPSGGCCTDADCRNPRRRCDLGLRACLPYPCEDSTSSVNQTSGCPAGQTCLIALGTCGIIACNDDSQCPSDLFCNPTNITCEPRACLDDSDCLAGLRCNESAECVPFDCIIDGDCPTGRSCKYQQCVPVACDSGNCPLNWVCNGLKECVPRNCDDDIDCPSGLYCDDFNQCVPFVCEEDSDCPYYHRCHHGIDFNDPGHASFSQCQPKPCIPDCPFDLRCDTDFDVCIPHSCIVDGVCPLGLECDVFEQCIPYTCRNVPVVVCPAGQRCDDFDQCVPRTCLTDSVCPAEAPRCNSFGQCRSGECNVDEDCTELGARCNVFYECEVPGNCIPGVNCDTECDFDSQCPGGQACNSQHYCYDPSKVECFGDFQCPEGKHCDVRFQCN